MGRARGQEDLEEETKEKDNVQEGRREERIVEISGDRERRRQECGETLHV